MQLALVQCLLANTRKTRGCSMALYCSSSAKWLGLREPALRNGLVYESLCNTLQIWYSLWQRFRRDHLTGYRYVESRHGSLILLIQRAQYYIKYPHNHGTICCPPALLSTTTVLFCTGITSPCQSCVVCDLYKTVLSQ